MIKYFLRINLILLLIIFTYDIEAKTINKPKKQIKLKPKQNEKDKSKSKSDIDISRKIEEKQKLLQLKTLEFEEELSELRRKIEKLRMKKEYEQAKMEADLLEFQKQRINAKKDTEELRLKIEQLKAKLEKSQQELQLATFEIEKKLKLSALNAEKAKANLERINSENELNKYITVKKTYPDNPLKKDGTLIISDRNIKLNGVVTMVKARYIVDRINFFNNKNSKKPIFLVIDLNMGGSVWAGALILNAMKSSKAPVYVVVKSMAASMAAIITTLAKKSFALPEAQIMHHQPIIDVQNYVANTTEQEYILKQNKKWAKRFLGKVAKKMGISLDKFIKEMYKNSPNGNWLEFADQAKKLKWVDHVIKGVEYNDISKLPNKLDYTRSKFIKELVDAEDEQVHLSKDNKGRTLMYIDPLPGEIFFIKKHPKIVIR